MNEDVLAVLADSKFLMQAKQLFSTVFWNSGWSGDYLLLAYETPDSDLAWFHEKGIKVRHCQAPDCGSEKFGDKLMACKFYLFTEYFKRWKNVVYLDADIVTRGSLQGLVGLDKFSACFSLGQTLKDNFIPFDKMPGSLVEEVAAKYDLNKKAFNAGVFAFPTSLIRKETFEELLRTFRKYVHYGLFGGDQLPINIYFYGNWNELPFVYNQITPLDNHSYNPKSLQGLVIHCVSFGKGPWKEGSLFYDEWKSNFDKADSIDLGKIPKVRVPTPKEIADRSNSVAKADLLGGAMNAKTVFNIFVRIGKLAVTNPAKIFDKVKLLLGDK